MTLVHNVRNSRLEELFKEFLEVSKISRNLHLQILSGSKLISMIKYVGDIFDWELGNILCMQGAYCEC